MSEDSSLIKEFGVIPLNCLEPTHELRRAYDLLIVPQHVNDVQFMRMVETSRRAFLGDIEAEMFTGFVKISNAERKMRGALVLFNGRCCGAVFGDKIEPHTPPAEDALVQLIGELEFDATAVMKYRQPVEIIIPFSSLFLGYPVEREDAYTAKDYTEYICDWFRTNGATAVLALTCEMRTALLFYFKGALTGFYDIDDVTFDPGEARLTRFLERMPEASAEVSILPPEFVTNPDSPNFGFRLSSYF